MILPCKAEKRASTNAILFVYSGAASSRCGGRCESGEGSWQKRRQMPQMGFQSVLIYWSPWGLLGVVICLCLGWHDRCPSCLRSCSHRSSGACRIIRSSINSLALHLVMKTGSAEESFSVVHFPSRCLLCVYCFEEVKIGDKPSAW